MHEEVDAEEHSQWMIEATKELANSNPTEIRTILDGVSISGRTTMSVFDFLYAKHLTL